MPRPVDSRATYIPALDGIRAIAVIAVLAYHLAVPDMTGGFLGVAVFFTLSGYLITGLLLDEHRRTGGIALGGFWKRRLRRLVPALVAVVAVVMATTLIVQPAELGTRTGQAISALLYVNNWWEIAQGTSYFDLFAGPGPFDHLWSLSIEEQFYVLWPLIVVGALALARGRRWPLVVLTAIGVVISFWLLWHLAVPGLDNTRAYQGTDTRAGGLLVGVLGAFLVRARWFRLPGWAAGLTGAAGLAGTLAVIWYSTDVGLGMFQWSIAAVSVSTVVLCIATRGAANPVSRLLSIAPMRWVGERSYGLYLWHMPIIAFLPRGEMSDLVWMAAVVVLTLGVTELSWSLLEDPIRRHGFRGAFSRAAGGRVQAAVPTEAKLRRDVGDRLAAAGGLEGPRGLDGLTYDQLRSLSSSGDRRRATPFVALLGLAVVTTSLVAPPMRDAAQGDPMLAQATAPLDAPTEPVLPEFPSEPGTEPLSTSCRSVMHLGDSTSISLMSESYLPDRADWVDEQYRKVGVADPRTEISGARSAVEGYQGQPNSTDVAAGHVAGGYRGCWVTAIGTNDAANVQAGSLVGLRERVDLTMNAVGDEQVLWLTLRTQNPTNSYYSDEGMQALNREILAACERYPNMRVYDWAAQVEPEWYTTDGIHFATDGSRERARRIARALATAFPADEPAVPGCVVLPR